MGTALKSTRVNSGKIPILAPRPRGRPLKSSVIDLDDHIIAAAAELFVQRGYERTSTNDVAAAAFCSKRTLYARFKTKAGLFEAVITKLISELSGDLDTHTSPAEDLSSKYHNEAQIFVKFLLNPHILGLQSLIHREAARFPELAKIAEGAGRKPLTTRFKAILEQDRAAIASSEGLDFLVDQFFYLLQGPIVRRTLSGDTDVTSQVLADTRRVVDFWLRGCGIA